jgi:hypothetical protein
MEYLNKHNIEESGTSDIYSYSVERKPSSQASTKEFSLSQGDIDNFYSNNGISDSQWHNYLTQLRNTGLNKIVVTSHGYVYSIKRRKMAGGSGFKLQLPRGREIRDSICSAITIPIPQGDYNNPIRDDKNAYTYLDKRFLGSLMKRMQGFYDPDTTGDKHIPRILDMVLLPYCPIKGNDKPEMDGNTIKTIIQPTGYITQDIGSNPTEPVYPFWSVEESSVSFGIENPYVNEDTSKDRKFTEQVRLVAPNYNGVFQFNIYDNDGLDGFNVDMTIKPNDTFLQIQPMFKGLYSLFGKDFNDNRGLIVGGSMSMENSSNAYTQYVMNNKTYQQQFDRSIQNMNFNYSSEVQRGAIAQNITQRGYDMQMIQQGVGMATGGISGAVNGGTMGGPAGAMAGGLSGVAGGVVGMATTAYAKGLQQWGYEEDLRINNALFAESVAMQKDMFNMNISNIKGQPATVNRNTSFNAVSKYFPFLEVYEALDIEKGYIKEYFTYRNYAINKYGNISDYMKTNEEILLDEVSFEYIEFNPVKIDGVPTNIANEIRRELNAGFYWENNVQPPIEVA